MKQKLPFLIIILFLFSCGTQKQTTQMPVIEEETTLLISYYQTSGYSKETPEYTIELFSNRQMYLTATKNLDKEGKFMRTLPEKEFNMIINTFNDAKFFRFEDEYTSTMTDLPTRYLYFSHNGKEKKVKDYYGAPDKIKELEYLMQSFLDRIGWEKMSW